MFISVSKVSVGRCGMEINYHHSGVQLEAIRSVPHGLSIQAKYFVRQRRTIQRNIIHRIVLILLQSVEDADDLLSKVVEEDNIDRRVGRHFRGVRANVIWCRIVGQCGVHCIVCIISVGT